MSNQDAAAVCVIKLPCVTTLKTTEIIMNSCSSAQRGKINSLLI